MTIENVERGLHKSYLSILNLYRFVKQDAFQRAYKLSSDNEKTKVQDLINRSRQVDVAAWTRTILEKHHEYEYLDARYLRELVQDSGGTGYTVMTKNELIAYLTKMKGSKNGQAIAH